SAGGAGGFDMRRVWPLRAIAVRRVWPLRAIAVRRVWPTALLLLAVLGAWEVYVDAGGADPSVLPPPHQIASAMWTDRGLLWTNFRPTAAAMLLGILLAAVLGLAIASAMHLLPWL